VRLLQVAIALDQAFNTLAGGWADETLSARAWRMQNRSPRWKYARIIIDAVFFWQPNHCLAAYTSEVQRKQFPKDYQNV
jgi:hypothetical protein